MVLPLWKGPGRALRFDGSAAAINSTMRQLKLTPEEIASLEAPYEPHHVAGFS